MSETTAYGVMDLSGYQVSCGTEKSGKYHFAALPPLDNMRTFYFFAESEGERNRSVYTCMECVFTKQIIVFMNFSDGLKQ